MPLTAPTPSPPQKCLQCGALLSPGWHGDLCPVCHSAGLVAEGDFEVDGYEILEVIGRGGMGLVCKARQESSGRVVALKMVIPETLRAREARGRFLMEIQTMAAVQHPGLIRLYDAGEDRLGRPWLAMRYMEGGTLAQRLSSYFNESRKSAQLLVRVARAVAYAHERGVLHRDLKPANILFDAEDHVYVADFGLAQWAGEDAEAKPSDAWVGSPAYLAPEVATSGAQSSTTVSDVYGLGAILYEMLCGVRPYQGQSVPEVLSSIVDKPPQRPRRLVKTIPRDLEIIVLKAMSRESGSRYSSATDMADDVQRWLDGVPILAKPVGRLGRLWSWAKRQPALAVLSVLVGISVVASGLLLWSVYRRLTHSLADANERVEYMTRELPSALAPLGRLDVLEGVFENVSEHYTLFPATEPEGLARRADFLAQWAGTCLPRGQVRLALAKLDEAWTLIHRAAPGSGPVALPIASTRVFVGWKLAEALIRAREFDRAETIIKETSAFVAAQKSQDLAFRSLVAEFTLEAAYLELGRQQPEAAVAPVEAAITLWQGLRPELEARLDSPWVLKALVTAGLTYDIAALVQEKIQDSQKALAARDKAVEEAKGLQQLVPTYPQFRYHYAHTLMRAAGHYSDDVAKKKQMLMESDRHFSALLANDHGNIWWRAGAAEVAQMLSAMAKAENNMPERDRWCMVTADRIQPLYHVKMSDEGNLKQLSRTAFFCGNFCYRLKDWSRLQLHWEAALRTVEQITLLEGSSTDHSVLLTKYEECFKLMTNAIGEEAAKAWLAKVKKPQR